MSLNRVVIWTANALLTVLCCWLAAGIAGDVVGGLLTPSAPVESAAPALASLPETRSWENRRAILDRNLFHSSTIEPTEPTPEDLAATKLPLKLLGTAAGGTVRSSWAAVEDLEKRQHLVVRIGDRLQGKAEVTRIERRRIVLRNAGRLEELALGEDDSTVTAANRRGRRAQAQPAMATDQARGNSPVERVQRLAENRFGVARDDVQSVANNPAALFSQARILPKYEEGQMVGVQLNAIQSGSLFEQIGIQNGDTITEFNGINITSQQDSAAVLRQLTEASEFNVTVTGADGQQRVMTYELSQ